MAGVNFPAHVSIFYQPGIFLIIDEIQNFINSFYLPESSAF
jgi:hypothetical protein